MTGIHWSRVSTGTHVPHVPFLRGLPSSSQLFFLVYRECNNHHSSLLDIILHLEGDWKGGGSHGEEPHKHTCGLHLNFRCETFLFFQESILPSIFSSSRYSAIKLLLEDLRVLSCNEWLQPILPSFWRLLGNRILFSECLEGTQSAQTTDVWAANTAEHCYICKVTSVQFL